MRLHCIYCGRHILIITTKITAKGHIQNLHVVAVCDECGKPNEAKYDQHDFKVQEQGQYQDKQDFTVFIPSTGTTTTLNRCSRCGGSLYNGICRACEAVDSHNG